MRNIKKMRELDQFYTDEKVADYCINILKDKVGHLIDDSDVFLEPSAGCGAFVDSVNKDFPDNKVLSYDIDPMRPDIERANFLETDLSEYSDLITIGNPPFGKRAKLALEFYEKTMEHSKFVAFIVPVQFNKWGTQRKINKDFKLIHNETLDPHSFIFDGKSYPVRSTFQIWTRLETDYKDTRMVKAPPTSHKDFKMWQHNNTKQTLKYFDYDWDFAMVRQGYGDYTKILYNKDELNTRTQYMFLKAKDDEILNRLKNIDFEELSQLNTSTPGFGKADLVTYYTDRYEKDDKK